MVPTILLFITFICSVEGFGAPGIIPPETFIAERWYPSNLATVMPPWKTAGADITSFHTARPHNPPGTIPTTTLASPTASLPMPPGTSGHATVLITNDLSTTGPHPPAPQSNQSDSDVSSTTDNSLETESNTTSSGEEPMIISVTATNNEKAPALPTDAESGVLRILSPNFEDITKNDTSTEVLDSIATNINDGFEASGEAPETIEIPRTSTIPMSTVSTTTILSSESTTVMSETTIKPTTEIAQSTTVHSKNSATPEISETVENIETSPQPSTSITSTTTESITTSTTAQPSTKKHIVEGEITSTVKPENTSTTPLMSSTSMSVPENLVSNEKLQKTGLVEKECKDILFLLDSSGNVFQQYEKQKRFIEEIVNKLELSHERRMALITYSGRSRQKIVVPLPTEPNAPVFLEKLKKSRFLRGVTATGAALSVTTQYVLQKGRNVQVVVVTDGFSFDDVHNQAEALRSIDGIETYTTGRYFPVVKNVLLSIGGAADHVFFDKNEEKIYEALQC